MKTLKRIGALFLIMEDWFRLLEKTKLYGVESCYDYALRLKLRIQGSYIGSSAVFSSKPVFPHGISGIFISGGGESRA